MQSDDDNDDDDDMILVKKPEKRPLGKTRSIWDDNIKMDLQISGSGRGMD
jgi:hypothetical protein